MIASVIDIGTNTVLLLVAEIDRAGVIHTLEYRQRVPRLGRGVDERKVLQRESMERVVEVLLEYKNVMARYQSDRIAVCATSAARDAANREEFADLVRRRTGFDLEILSGDDEAYWTYRGAISGIEKAEHATVVDIGGGSTELTRGTTAGILGKVSLDVGSVRLTERLLQHDPPLPSEIEAVHGAVSAALGSAPPSFARGPGTLVGVAGTATTLALLAQRRTSFDLAAVSGYVLRKEAVAGLVSQLQKLTGAEILRLGEYMEGRNDILTAGAMILEAVMDFLGASEVIVSERGVRYGIALREREK